ncbi:DNA polymerase III subunit delta' [Atlantibacter sp.]|uniref:DNA polymerase III subunit delta' n=1 Tax=Atlantibacter sp. TaxID=1903473 RepID=UPI00289F5A8F|nr:DNA polymerase III subunit delta' [Atlantibacter sp.]
MKWYPWLRPAYEQLVGNHQVGRGHHALLVHALPGMGDDALIYAISRWLMCQKPDGLKSCGQCRACQLMQAQTHPDYYAPEPEKGKAALGIDAIREVTEKLYDHARLGGAKVVWLRDAEQLTEAAANALLKTLEEPPEKTWFMLGCRNPDRLPATLRSRCLYWHLPPPEDHWAEAWLARECDAPQPQRISALRLTGGAPAAALALLQNPAWPHRQRLAETLEKAVNTRDALALLPELHHDDVLMRLHWLAALLLDALKSGQGAGAYVTHIDLTAYSQLLAASLSENVLQSMLTQTLRCREQLSSVAGLNRELMLTELLLTWEQVWRTGSPNPYSHL